MRLLQSITSALFHLSGLATAIATPPQEPLLHHVGTGRGVSAALFTELEELARIVDITYCVGLTSLGIIKPFQCLSRCSDFPSFELVTTWNTGPLLSDSCGYIALDHGKRRIIVAFRGTYSVANTVVDLSTVPQEYVPYPGSDDDDAGRESASVPEDVGKEIMHGIDGRVKRDVLAEDEDVKCDNCTVHMGFHEAWLQTRKHILQDLQSKIFFFPDYQLHLVGHSLGGAVAVLAALEFHSRGWNPIITTFGEPRVGNKGLMKYIDDRFKLKQHNENDDTTLNYRRVTHIDDHVPLLPLSEWGFAMHAGEIYISKPALTPDIQDLERCVGDNDGNCIAGQDSTTISAEDSTGSTTTRKRKRGDLLSSVQEEVHDLVHEPWGLPSRYKLWQLFFAHRDYFWRLGLCVPGGDPLGGGKRYDLELPRADL